MNITTTITLTMTSTEQEHEHKQQQIARAGALMTHHPAWVGHHTGGSRSTPTVHRSKGEAVGGSTTTNPQQQHTTMTCGEPRPMMIQQFALRVSRKHGSGAEDWHGLEQCCCKSMRISNVRTHAVRSERCDCDPGFHETEVNRSQVCDNPDETRCV